MPPLAILVGLVMAVAVVGVPQQRSGHVMSESHGGANILLMFTDDLGYTDVGYHKLDRHVTTPAIDKLAKWGMSFSNGYTTAPECVPSRTAMMTGRHQASIGLVTNEADVGFGPANLPPKSHVRTIAELLSARGHVTGMAGKNSPLCEHHSTTDCNAENGLRGFQQWFMGYAEPHFMSYSNNSVEVLEDHGFKARAIYDDRGAAVGGVSVEVRHPDFPMNRIDVTAAITVGFIRRFKKTEPSASRFYFVWTPYGPHSPVLVAGDKYVKAFDGKSIDYAAMSHEETEIRVRGLAMINAIDQGVEDIMHELRKSDLEENTLVVFSSDNGARAHGSWSPSQRFQRSVHCVNPYAGSDNVPLRGEKDTLWEGGLRVPMVAFWKGTIQPHQVNDDPTSVLDIVATFGDLFGVLHEQEFDGVSLLNTFRGGRTRQVHATSTDLHGLKRGKALHWFHPGNREDLRWAIRVGPWKLIIIDRNTAMLFNVADDREELHDVANLKPDVVGILRSRYDHWFEHTAQNHNLGALHPSRNDDVAIQHLISTTISTQGPYTPAWDAKHITACTADFRYIVNGTPTCYPAPIDRWEAQPPHTPPPPSFPDERRRVG